MRKKKTTQKYNSGISLMEILIVIAIFAVLGVIVSSSLVLTIQGTRKSEALQRVRENLNYSVSVIERNLRNANAITDCTNPLSVTYLDQYGKISSFSCVGVGGSDSYIASDSARLTSNNVQITGCSFVCTEPTDLSSPPMVTIDISAKDSIFSGANSASMNAQSKIYLRN